jgi:hypothetical protein
MGGTERSIAWNRTPAASPSRTVTRPSELARRLVLLTTLVLGIIASGSAGLHPV